MMTRESGKKREQIQLMSLDDLVPQDHLVRKSEAALDRNFIYELVEEKCSEDSERPSIDLVVLIKLLSTYGRPKTKKGFFPKHEYVYDEYYDCYTCPNNQLLHYATTNRDGYREYRSCGAVFAGCPYPAQCTNSKEHVKTITWHMWAADLEEMEENRCTCGIREYYKLREETIERDFALAKELHSFRYTQEYGQARMAWKAALAFACINSKKLARMAWNAPETPHIPRTFVRYLHDFISFLKTPPPFSPAGGVCLQSEERRANGPALLSFIPRGWLPAGWTASRCPGLRGYPPAPFLFPTGKSCCIRR